MKGRCLCGKVEFEIRDAPGRLYQCHCSLCRKQSGSAANAAFIVPSENLSWRAGQRLIRSYAKPSGFRSDFCGRCGSPVPNLIGATRYFWVPAGLLEGSPKLEIVMHLFVGSKASWEPTPTNGVLHEEMPALTDLLEILHSEAGT